MFNQERYRHYEGEEYQVLTLATDAESGEKMVVYVDEDNKALVLPYKRFHGFLEDGRKRFQRIKE